MPSNARTPTSELADYGQGLSPGERRPARYAASALPTRGRRHAEPECPTRSPWQRDRDRVLHSTSFRRLMHKTQVFVYHEGDHFRTRLTHSLEVAQIARGLARSMSLDVDLADNASTLITVGANVYLTARAQLRFMFESQDPQAPGAKTIAGIRSAWTMNF